MRSSIRAATAIQRRSLSGWVMSAKVLVGSKGTTTAFSNGMAQSPCDGG
ncbi:Uncharacterised protein [Mycobacterium tuberculosis]|uniref:Uncharacterized protein n=1 Tax=Mycobacterium tuberculosis TaxID=1773 RepID=A0A654TW89_MYCTX|nr:Uncharacterised protein [Mycobacterium tuberculosis]CKQ41845.1 Uncharacterised protein [Mycobacterium tuberculosis]CKT63115.1 Uncharacterised protein [Mycobacterium tuberculosis]COV66907.1 Uncharacterised protein [Mycobacterium tuberculosis]COW61719.1 Uncharacterised protein [Mycobacterium tuberculosis]